MVIVSKTVPIFTVALITTNGIITLLGTTAGILLAFVNICSKDDKFNFKISIYIIMIQWMTNEELDAPHKVFNFALLTLTSMLIFGEIETISTVTHVASNRVVTFLGATAYNLFAFVVICNNKIDIMEWGSTKI